MQRFKCQFVRGVGRNGLSLLEAYLPLSSAGFNTDQYIMFLADLDKALYFHSAAFHSGKYTFASELLGKTGRRV